MNTDAASSDFVFGGRLPVVVFHSGGWRIALEGRHVAAMRPDGAGDDGTGRDVEELLGLPAVGDASHRRRLLIRRDGATFSLRVCEPVEFTSFDCATIRPLPPLIAARIVRPAVRALQVDGAGLTLLIDPTRWA